MRARRRHEVEAARPRYLFWVANKSVDLFVLEIAENKYRMSLINCMPTEADNKGAEAIELKKQLFYT